MSAVYLAEVGRRNMLGCADSSGKSLELRREECGVFGRDGESDCRRLDLNLGGKILEVWVMRESVNSCLGFLDSKPCFVVVLITMLAESEPQRRKGRKGGPDYFQVAEFTRWGY